MAPPLEHQSHMELVQQEILKNLPDYQSGISGKQGGSQVQPKAASAVRTSFHSPSSSETSTLFSTVDCSSFSSRSDASSFAKEEASSVTPSISVSVNSSIDFLPPAARLNFEEREHESELKAAGASSRGSGYFEFTFMEGKMIDNKDDDAVCFGNLEIMEQVAKQSSENSQALHDDAYETFPVWTDRTRYCSKDIHTCVNPCFDETLTDDDSAQPRVHASRRKKLAKSLGSVISRHLTLSPGPTFRRTTYEAFRSRLALENSSPLSKKFLPATPARTFEEKDVKSGYNSSPGSAKRYIKGKRSQDAAEILRTRSGINFSASTSRKTSLYGTSPKRGSESKSLGCLGLTNGSSKTVEETSLDVYKGPLYFASEETVHGGKNRCLPSPRLSFGGKAPTGPKDDNIQPNNNTMSMVVPSSTVHGHVHCVVRNEFPSFTFLVDGLEEVLVAKALPPSSPDRLEGSEIVYMFYSWKPKGRARGNWKTWVRKDKTVPDLVGKMILTSRVVPAETKDGNDLIEVEFVLLDGSGATCSPRVSFSTWDTGLSPHSSCRSPVPAFCSYPSPFSMASPSPGRLPALTSSRYVSMSMVPANLTSPRIDRPDPRFRRSKKSQSASPLRPRSDDERSTFQDAWSDSEVTEIQEVKEQSELAAIIVRISADGNNMQSVWETLNQKWCTKPLKNAASSRKSSYCRRFSLPGRIQVTETKENQEDYKRNGSRPTQNPKLRELMGVKADFGKEEEPDSAVTVILPAGNHGLPLYGGGGPQPLVDRWRSGGRCDCGSWDLGCGLTIMEGETKSNNSDDDSVKIFPQQGKNQNQAPVMSLGAVDEGLFPFSFQAPMCYLQAFACTVAVLYSRGPITSPDCSKGESCVSSSSSSKPPRIPLRPLMSSQKRGALTGYCSSPPPCLLDRL